MSFDPQHVTRFPPIENVFEVGGITTSLVLLMVSISLAC